MIIFVAQNRDGSVHIVDNEKNLPAPKHIMRLKEMVVNDIGEKRRMIVNLEKYKLVYDSEED